MTTALRSIGFKMDSDTLDLASEVIKENGYNLNKVMRLYLKSIAVTKKIDLPSEEELDNEFLFMQLKKEVGTRISDVQAGNYYSDEDLVARYGL